MGIKQTYSVLVSVAVLAEPVLFGRSRYFLVGAGAGVKVRLRLLAPAPPKIKHTKFSMIFFSLVSTLIKGYKQIKFFGKESGMLLNKIING